MSGYFTMTPSIIDNNAFNHNGGSASVRITFEAGHTDDRDRPCFDVLVLVDDERMASLTLHYEAATELCKALKGAMRGDR
ncbi:MAG: hypothetical protein RLZZ217_2149 [Planctomycetota bacterium]|jgi:hypothetical protein